MFCRKTGDFQSFKYSGQDDEKDIFLFKEEYKHRKFNFVIHGWSDSFYTTYYVQDIRMMNRINNVTNI